MHSCSKNKFVFFSVHSPEVMSIFDCEYEGGDVSCYRDSSLCLPDESVTSDGSTSPGVLSSDEEESMTGYSVSWMEDSSSGENSNYRPQTIIGIGHMTPPGQTPPTPADTPWQTPHTPLGRPLPPGADTPPADTSQGKIAKSHY